jgi:CDP-glucose 4,6-dehydratase
MDDLEKVFKGKKVLVTGDTGFKGRWLVRTLQYFGADVSGLSVGAPYCRGNIQTIDFEFNYQSARFNILDKPQLKRYFQEIRPEFVFHFAAEAIFQNGILNPLETFETNTVGTLNVISECIATQSVKSLVVATTDKVYENSASGLLFNEDSIIGGTDPYSASKACADILCKSVALFQNSRDLRISTVRAGNIVGGGDWGEGRLIPDIYQASVSGEVLNIRNLEATRPFQYVLDAINGYLLVAQSHTEKMDNERNTFEAFNVGPVHSISVQEVLTITESVLNFKYAQVSNQFAVHEAQRLFIDSSKLRKQLGWKPKFTSEEAIKETIDWYKEYGYACQVTPSDIKIFFGSDSPRLA